MRARARAHTHAERWAALALLATACASSPQKVWMKPGATVQDWRRDSYDCQRESRTFAGGSGIAGAIAISQAKREAERMYRMCMEAREWELRVPPEGTTIIE